MNDLEKFRTRWHRWLGQKCRRDKPHWTTLLNTNWSGWADKVMQKNGSKFHLEDQTRKDVKIYFSLAIELADIHDLLVLDNLYCQEIVDRM